MQNLSDLKIRIKAVKDTGQITKAMETVSIAKMRKANIKHKNNLEFFKKIRTTISDIVLHTGAVEHRYLSERNGGRALFIVVASDKGLCGGYNHNVLQLAYERMSSYSNPAVFTVGLMARDFLSRRNIGVDVEFISVSTDHTMQDAVKITDSVLQLYDQDLLDEVYIAYTELEANGSTTPHILRLLPMTREHIIEENREITLEHEYYLRELEYDPSPDDVLNELIPLCLTGIIYGALVQSSAAEHSSRRMAMNNASKNASEIVSRLSLVYNRVRQSSVTNEINEIITSGMAVK